MAFHQVFFGFEWYKSWRYMKNHQKPCLKPFLGPENRYLDHLWDIIFILEKVRFPPPSRTQTRISWVRNWILTFRKKRWLCIEKLFHTNSTCFFTALHPYRLNQKKAQNGKNCHNSNLLYPFSNHKLGLKTKTAKQTTTYRHKDLHQVRGNIFWNIWPSFIEIQCSVWKLCPKM